MTINCLMDVYYGDLNEQFAAHFRLGFCSLPNWKMLPFIIPMKDAQFDLFGTNFLVSHMKTTCMKVMGVKHIQNIES